MYSFRSREPSSGRKRGRPRVRTVTTPSAGRTPLVTRRGNFHHVCSAAPGPRLPPIARAPSSAPQGHPAVVLLTETENRTDCSGYEPHVNRKSAAARDHLARPHASATRRTGVTQNTPPGRWSGQLGQEALAEGRCGFSRAGDAEVSP